MVSKKCKLCLLLCVCVKMDRCRNIQYIQSCLSKITSIREKDLDLAQKYFAMLYVNEEVSKKYFLLYV